MFNIEYNTVSKKISLFYNNVKIALWSDIEREDVDSLVLQYIRTYGYMAQYRALWNTGQKVNWNDSMWVASHGYPINTTIVQA